MSHQSEDINRDLMWVGAILLILALLFFGSCNDEFQPIPEANDRLFIDTDFQNHLELTLYIGINANACAIQLESHRLRVTAERTEDGSLQYDESIDIGGNVLYGQKDTVSVWVIHHKDLLPIDEYLFKAVIYDVTQQNCNTTDLTGQRVVRWQL